MAALISDIGPFEGCFRPLIPCPQVILKIYCPNSFDYRACHWTLQILVYPLPLLCVLWLSRQRIWFLLLMSTYFSMPSTWLLKLDYGSRSEHQLHRQLKWARRNPFIVCSFPYCFWWTISKAFWFGLNFSACSRFQGCYFNQRGVKITGKNKMNS